MGLEEDVQQPFLSERASSFDLTFILCLKREENIYSTTILLVNNMNLIIEICNLICHLWR